MNSYLFQEIISLSKVNIYAFKKLSRASHGLVTSNNNNNNNSNEGHGHKAMTFTHEWVIKFHAIIL